MMAVEFLKLLFIIFMTGLSLLQSTSAQCPPCSCIPAGNVICFSITLCPKDVTATFINMTFQKGDCGRTISRTDFQRQSNLKRLVIKEYPYQVVDDHAFADTQLVSLIITNTSLQSFFPGALSSLNQLTELDLTNNQIAVVPDNLFQDLQSVGKLLLSTNKISYLSDGIFNGLASVALLDLSNNLISAVGTNTFKPLTKLSSLKLSHNLLTTLPGNFLAGVPITALFVDYNHLSNIHPDAFLNSSLLAFKMDHNSFTDFPAAAFQRMNRHFQGLILSNNNIDKLDGGALANLKIQTLDLSFNPLKTIDPAAFSGGTFGIINLLNTALTTLPDSMSALLTKLQLKDLPNWECDCDALWLARFLVSSAQSTSPICDSKVSLKSSVQQLEAMCTTTTTTTTQMTTTTTMTTTPQPTTTTPQPTTTTPQPTTLTPSVQTSQPSAPLPTTAAVAAVQTSIIFSGLTSAAAGQSPMPTTKSPAGQVTTTPLANPTQAVTNPQPPTQQTLQPLSQTPSPPNNNGQSFTQAPSSSNNGIQQPSQSQVPSNSNNGQVQPPQSQFPSNSNNGQYYPAPSTENSTVNLGLIIGTVMGLTAAICSTLLALCMIHMYKLALVNRVSPYNQGSSRGKSFSRSGKKSKREDIDDLEQEDDDVESWPNNEHPRPRPKWLESQKTAPDQ